MKKLLLTFAVILSNCLAFTSVFGSCQSDLIQNLRNCLNSSAVEVAANGNSVVLNGATNNNNMNQVQVCIDNYNNARAACPNSPQLVNRIHTISNY
jgi:mevalonate pyrophosphate decarboxylase